MGDIGYYKAYLLLHTPTNLKQDHENSLEEINKFLQETRNFNKNDYDDKLTDEDVINILKFRNLDLCSKYVENLKNGERRPSDVLAETVMFEDLLCYVKSDIYGRSLNYSSDECPLNEEAIQLLIQGFKSGGCLELIGSAKVY